MLEMPSDLDRPWEPWAPRVGDRVRINRSGECDMPGEPGSWKDYHKIRGHSPTIDGVEGVIWGVMAPSLFFADRGHRFTVRFANGFVFPQQLNQTWHFDTFAAIELEPLEGNRA